jgi:hypothetical protein
MRVTVAAWKLLRQLDRETAALAFSVQDGRFYLTVHDEVVDLVRSSTIDALSAAGLIRRERTAAPWYSISDGGRKALRRHLHSGHV